MSLIWIKTVGAVIFLIAALAAFLTMMSMMGRPEKKTDPGVLRKAHHAAGWTAALLSAALALLGYRFWISLGDTASVRAVFHIVLASAFLVVLLLKLLIVKFYKQFLRLAPTLGLLLFALSLMTFSVSGGYTAARAIFNPGLPLPEMGGLESSAVPDAVDGKALFDNKCAACHHPDKREFLMGPGFSGLLKAETLPSGRTANRENILRQIREPMASMPAFPDLTEKEAAALLTYLETL